MCGNIYLNRYEPVSLNHIQCCKPLPQQEQQKYPLKKGNTRLWLPELPLYMEFSFIVSHFNTEQQKGIPWVVCIVTQNILILLFISGRRWLSQDKFSLEQTHLVIRSCLTDYVKSLSSTTAGRAGTISPTGLIRKLKTHLLGSPTSPSDECQKSWAGNWSGSGSGPRQSSSDRLQWY